MIRHLLADSLTVWKVRGSVTREREGVVIHADGHPVVRVAPGYASRWVVQSENGAARPCASIVGALSAVREVLGVSGGVALYITPRRTDA